MRILGILVSAGLGLLPAATLEKLSFDDLIQKSTEIVCAKVVGTSSIQRGPMVYTRYKVSIVDQYKGTTVKEMDVHVPGGQYGSTRQTFAGTPNLEEGGEYVLFLWTGRSGLTQVIGLTQGLFTMKRDSKGEATMSRNASSELVVDSSGKLVEDTPVSMRLRDVVDRIHRSLTGGNQK